MSSMQRSMRRKNEWTGKSLIKADYETLELKALASSTSETRVLDSLLSSGLRRRSPAIYNIGPDGKVVRLEGR